MIVDIQSDTLDDAFGQLQAHISPGFDVLSARIFIDEDRSVQAGAGTIDQAYTEVVRKIPGDFYCPRSLISAQHIFLWPKSVFFCQVLLSD